MRANPMLLGLKSIFVVIGAVRLGGNLGRGDNQKRFSPHAFQQ